MCKRWHRPDLFAVVRRLCLLLLVAGCRHPAAGFDDQATALGFTRTVVPGTDFEHVVYGNDRPAAGALHVYLDGDGTPWLGGRPAADPTPRQPLMLQLMASDPVRAVYLGRPCYHGLAAAPACRSDLWTSGRYSEAVVASMAAALRRLLATEGERRLVFFGYSGGGTLAVLLAARFAETTAVVTVAANLDTAAWTRYRGYPPLDGSLNPALQPPLSARIRQHHYAGDNDSIVPPALIRDAARRWGATVTVVPGFDHRCCWQQMWPAILATLPADAPAGGFDDGSDDGG